MARIFPSITVQTNSHSLRNALCSLQSPAEMGAVSSHLRNFAVAETIGLIGLLDSHPEIKGVPAIRRVAAVYQQTGGTRPNPFTHVAPCGLTLNQDDLTAFFKTAKARSTIERIFGMGVMAPDNWAELGGFGTNPSQLNIADNIAEGFAKASGLVAAFETTAAAALSRGKWDGSGRHQHNTSSLTDFIAQHYRDSWKPAALAAYQSATGHLRAALSAAERTGGAEREGKIKRRIELIETQIDVLNQQTVNFSEATRNVVAATAEEQWS